MNEYDYFFGQVYDKHLECFKDITEDSDQRFYFWESDSDQIQHYPVSAKNSNIVRMFPYTYFLMENYTPVKIRRNPYDKNRVGIMKTKEGTNIGYFNPSLNPCMMFGTQNDVKEMPLCYQDFFRHFVVTTESLDYLLGWMSATLKRHTRIFCYLKSSQQSTGKGNFWQIFKRLHGDFEEGGETGNSIELNKRVLEGSQFTQNYEGKTAVFIDEMSDIKHGLYQVLKLFAENSINIHLKGQTERTVENLTNLVIASNDDDLRIQTKDRRFFFPDLTDKKIEGSIDFKKHGVKNMSEFSDLLQKKENIAKLYRFLYHYKSSNYDDREAIMTKTKQEFLNKSSTDWQPIAASIIENLYSKFGDRHSQTVCIDLQSLKKMLEYQMDKKNGLPGRQTIENVNDIMETGEIKVFHGNKKKDRSIIPTYIIYTCKDDMEFSEDESKIELPYHEIKIISYDDKDIVTYIKRDPSKLDKRINWR